MRNAACTCPFDVYVHMGRAASAPADHRSALDRDNSGFARE